MSDNIDLNSYDYIIIAHSGGKDSIACHLNLLDLGVDQSKIELWHHCVDGDYRSSEYFFDWPVTTAYCEAYGKAFNTSMYFSWRDGGLNREMHRKDQTTAGVYFEEPFSLGNFNQPTYLPPSPRAKKNTRRMFPQVTANLSQRWCSASAKIDLSSRAMNNQERFKGKRTLFITGERAQESSARAKYKTFEPHRSHAKCRHVDAWRPIHGWSEEQVWEIIQRYQVNPHPAYKLGFGRLSCMNCIFASPDQISSIRAIDPDRFDWVVRKEVEFGKTIHRKHPWSVLVDKGTPYPAIAANPQWVSESMKSTYTSEIIIDAWQLPSGAYGESTGPT